MKIYLRKRKHFESAIGFPVDFLIGQLLSGEACRVSHGQLRARFHLERHPSPPCTLCAASTACGLLMLCSGGGSLGCKCA